MPRLVEEVYRPLMLPTYTPLVNSIRDSVKLSIESRKKRIEMKAEMKRKQAELEEVKAKTEILRKKNAEAGARGEEMRLKGGERAGEKSVEEGALLLLPKTSLTC